MNCVLAWILMATGSSSTFYRRQLPDLCVAFSSRQGRSHLESSMRHRGLKSFFVLTEQHLTQSDPAYCGISTLVMALNALAVDPRQTWKGPWRWYEESMLNCCVDLELVKETGITLNIFNCLALCQGLSTELKYAVDVNMDEDTSQEVFRKAVQEACVEPLEESEWDADGNSDSQESSVQSVLIVSYSRRILGQTGSGHFSPIAAYDRESDSVLILDTARFKYGAHWVKLPLLFDAMKPIDPDTGRSRGHVLLSNDRVQRLATAHIPTAVVSLTLTEPDHLPVAVMLRTEMQQNRVRRDLKQYLDRWKEKRPTLRDIERFCTRNWTDSSFVWEISMPHFLPCVGDTETNQIVDDVRALIHHLLKAYPEMHGAAPGTGFAKSNLRSIASSSATCKCQRLQLQPEEAIFIVYIACLSKDERVEAVTACQDLPNIGAWASQQLLDEAELLRCAIDLSDEMDSLQQRV